MVREPGQVQGIVAARRFRVARGQSIVSGKYSYVVPTRQRQRLSVFPGGDTHHFIESARELHQALRLGGR